MSPVVGFYLLVAMMDVVVRVWGKLANRAPAKPLSRQSLGVGWVFTLLVPMRVLVTGSRNWKDGVRILETLRGLPRGTTIVHGGSRGADMLADDCCLFLGLEPERHLAQWGEYGRAAGPIRNREMLDTGIDQVIAFPLPESKGTWDCVREAERRGIPVRIVAG